MNGFVRATRLLQKELVPLIQDTQDLGVSRAALQSFAKYFRDTFDTELQAYGSKAPDIATVTLESVFPTQYKVMVKDQELRNLEDFVSKLRTSADLFKGNENTYKVLVCFYTLYTLIVVKLVMVWASTVAQLNTANPGSFSVGGFTLDHLGIDKSTLRYYDLMLEVRTKSLDEWVLVHIPDDECRYIESMIKRIFYSLRFDAKN